MVDIFLGLDVPQILVVMSIAVGGVYFLVGKDRFSSAFGAEKSVPPGVQELSEGDEEIWILENFGHRKVHVYRFDKDNNMAFAREFFKYGPKGEKLEVPIYPVIPGVNLRPLNVDAVGKYRVWVWAGGPTDSGVSEDYSNLGDKFQRFPTVSTKKESAEAKVNRELKDLTELRNLTAYEGQKESLKTADEKLRSQLQQLEGLAKAAGQMAGIGSLQNVSKK